ncbi:MAG: hypothetical protein JXA92_10935 [candidate division Zixibacteria bacterium]|nr:hypothetical protein [candidate division Zixibacteria bacterium]
MADKDQQNKSDNRISERERFRYIGFEVFPGKPKDLFRTDAEKKLYVDSVIEKRSHGDLLRHQCTLTEERVTLKEKLILTLACVVILFSLFIPWYSAYTEIVDKNVAATTVFDENAPVVSDSLAPVSPVGDSLGQTAAAVEPEGTANPDSVKTFAQEATSHEEVIHGMQAKRRVRKEYERLSGVGAILALGSVGSYIFSSGFILVITAILFLVYTLLCIGLPLFNLYNIFGMKGKEDDKALTLKKYLKWNWIPVILFVFTLVLSFFGANYAPDAVGTFTSIGVSYGPAVFLDSLSWGIFITIGAFILLAVKGVEI